MKLIKKYKFSDKNHSLGGSISVVMGIVSLVILCILIVNSTKDNGMAGVHVGIMGMVAAIIALTGCVVGLLSFREEEKYYLTSKIGSLLCGILTVFFVAVFLMGLGI